MTLGRLRKAKATPTPAAGLLGGSLTCLPADMLEDASRRLGWAALIYAATFFLAYFGAHLFFLGQAPGVPEETLFSGDRAVQSWVAIGSIAMALGVFALSRFGRVRPALLLDIGLIFEVVGAFGISMSTFWGIFSEWSGVFMQEFAGVPWECVWIVIFPLLAPNTPGKTFFASLAAASTGLLTVTLSQAAGLTHPDVPFVFFLGYFVFTTYLCAGIAFAVSHVIYHFGCQLDRAREVGSYQLVRRLGQGGMGEVWLARHRMLARPAAVKLIRPEALGDDEKTRRNVLRRFEREAQATAALRSYHTIELFDFGVTDEGAFYYVMGLLRGLDLESLVRNYGPLPAPRAVYLLRQICHSLGEAHDAGMIHRDIKPANIYACRLGPDDDFVKVLDFGLVKSIDGRGAREGMELTAEGIATGTPAFMAPEMAVGRADIDGRVDIYGLGCVGYWLLTGSRVFEAESPLATVVAHVQETPVPPSQRTELPIDESLEKVILACLEKEPARRPKSAAELDARLAACGLDGEWGNAKAREWWELHQPDLPGAVDAVDESPSGVLAVKQELF